MTDTPALITPCESTLRAGPDPQPAEADEARRRDPARLSVRQREVFHLIGLGHANREIAEALGVSVKTVETHKENIKAKLQLPSTRVLATAARVWLHLPADDHSSSAENEKPHGAPP